MVDHVDDASKFAGITGKYLACRHNGKPPSDVYLETDCFMDYSSERGISWSGAERCGITRPGYPEKATYKIGGAIYVYDAGWLVPMDAWYGIQGG